MTACRIIGAIQPTPQSRRKPGLIVRMPGQLKSRPRLSPGLRWCLSSVGRLEGELLGNLGLPAVAIREQLFLVVEELLARLGGEFEIRALDDRIDRACLLAIAAIDAFRHIDVVAGRAATAILAWFRLDRDRERRADRLAQFAGDAPLLAIGVTAQHVLAAKPRAQRALFIRVIDRDRALKHVAQGQGEAGNQLGQEEAARKARHDIHLSILDRTIAAGPRPFNAPGPSRRRSAHRRSAQARTAKTAETPSNRAASAGRSGSAERSRASTGYRTSRRTFSRAAIARARYAPRPRKTALTQTAAAILPGTGSSSSR